ncbi:MAG: hypothetical protein ABIP29_12185 [Candidatus Eisenbacteria bacterium]
MSFPLDRHRRSALPAALLALVFVLCVGVGAGGGCGKEDDDEAARTGDVHQGGSGVTPSPTPGDPDLITKNGTVRHLDLEGGFWGIVADDSTRYDPGSLDPRYQNDGMRVRFDARKAEGQMSIRQWGTLVTIVRIDPL